MVSILHFPIFINDTVIGFDPDNPELFTLAVDNSGLAARIGDDDSVTPVGYTIEPIEGVDIGADRLQILLLRALLRISDAMYGTRSAELFDLYCATVTTASDIVTSTMGITAEESHLLISANIPGTDKKISIGLGIDKRTMVSYGVVDRHMAVSLNRRTLSLGRLRLLLNHRLGMASTTANLAAIMCDTLSAIEPAAVVRYPGINADRFRTAAELFSAALISKRPFGNYDVTTMRTFRTPPLSGVTLTGRQALGLRTRSKGFYASPWALRVSADLRGAMVVADGDRPHLRLHSGDYIDGASFSGCTISLVEVTAKDVTFDRCNFDVIAKTKLDGVVMRECDFNSTFIDGLNLRDMTIVGTITDIDAESISGLTLDGDDVDDLQALVDQTMKLNANGDGDGDGAAKIAFELTVGAEWVREEIRDAYVNGGNPRDMTDEEVAVLTALSDDVIGHALYRCIDDHVWAALDGLRSNVIDMLHRYIDSAN